MREIKNEIAAQVEAAIAARETVRIANNKLAVYSNDDGTVTVVGFGENFGRFYPNEHGIINQIISCIFVELKNSYRDLGPEQLLEDLKRK